MLEIKILREMKKALIGLASRLDTTKKLFWNWGFDKYATKTKDKNKTAQDLIAERQLQRVKYIWNGISEEKERKRRNIWNNHDWEFL